VRESRSPGSVRGAGVTRFPTATHRQFHSVRWWEVAIEGRQSETPAGVAGLRPCAASRSKVAVFCVAGWMPEASKGSRRPWLSVAACWRFMFSGLSEGAGSGVCCVWHIYPHPDKEPTRVRRG
jgi:hypothetical protein